MYAIEFSYECTDYVRKPVCDGSSDTDFSHTEIVRRALVLVLPQNNQYWLDQAYFYVQNHAGNKRDPNFKTIGAPLLLSQVHAVLRAPIHRLD